MSNVASDEEEENHGRQEVDQVSRITQPIFVVGEVSYRSCSSGCGS